MRISGLVRNDGAGVRGVDAQLVTPQDAGAVKEFEGHRPSP